MKLALDNCLRSGLLPNMQRSNTFAKIFASALTVLYAARSVHAQVC